MVDIREILNRWKPVIVMVLVQIAYSVMHILNKLVANEGMNLKILIACRMIFATAFMVPLALISERKRRPKLTWMILFQAFLCGLFGILLAINFYITSLALTSVTLSTAMSNLCPIMTFVLAICFGMENVGLGTRSGKAKLLGTLIAIGGAMVITFYKGPETKIWSTNINLLDHVHAQNGQKRKSNNLLGALASLGYVVTYAIWLIIQAKMNERYPFPYSSTALICLMGSIQCAVFAICTQKDWKEWNLGWNNIRLYTAIYSGIMVSGVVFCLIVWCIEKRGPVFISIFNPVALLLVALAGSLVLGENLHCGSVVGAILIVAGVYTVLWGKHKETKKKVELIAPQSSQESKQIEINHSHTVRSHVVIDEEP